MDIEEIKRAGAIGVLKSKIGSIKHELTNHVWNATEKDGSYCGLGKAIIKAEFYLKDMRILLEEIQKLDKGNT